MDNIIEAIARGIKEDIEKAFRNITINLWYAIREGWHLEIKQHVTPRHRFDIDEIPIGNIKLHQDHIACYGLTDYQTKEKTLFTTIEYADPEMSIKTCEATYKILHLYGQWKMMRDVMKSPVPNLDDEDYQ